MRKFVLVVLGLITVNSAQAIDFDAVVSLGDSLLDDSSGLRSPLVSEHLADRLAAPLTQLAVGGSTSTSLLSGGQHTQAASSFGAGDLAVLWIGGNDFFANALPITLGNFSFLNQLEANVETAMTTLRSSGLEVVVFNLPDMAQVPLVMTTAPAFARPQFTAAKRQ